MELQATDDDYQYDMQSLQAADEDYQFDELYDIPDQQTFYNGISKCHETNQKKCFFNVNVDLLVEYLDDYFEEIAWDNSLDLDTRGLSQPICNPEVEAWSSHIPNPEDEEFFELILNKDLESDINYDDELELGEQISSCEELLSDECREILSRPLKYSYMDEDLYSFPEDVNGFSQPVTQPSNSSSSLKSQTFTEHYFPSFDSVESIMQILDSMPSLQQRKVKQCAATNSDSPSSNLLQVGLPEVALVGGMAGVELDRDISVLPSGARALKPKMMSLGRPLHFSSSLRLAGVDAEFDGCVTHLEINGSISVSPSRVGAVQLGAVLKNPRSWPPHCRPNFGHSGLGGESKYSKLGLSLSDFRSARAGGPEVSMLLLVCYWIARGCRTRKNEQTLFDPGGS